MKRAPLWISLTVALALVAGAIAQAPDDKATDTAASKPAAVALEKMKNILAAEPTGQAEAEELFGKVIVAMGGIEKKFPDSEEVHEARGMGLWASGQLARIKKDSAVAAQAVALAKKIMASKAPAEAKLFADSSIVELQIRPVGGKAPDAEAAEKIVLAFVDRHKKTDQGAGAIKQALKMASLVRSRKLHEAMKARLVKEYPDDDWSKQIIAGAKAAAAEAAAGSGKLFEAELTKVDGTTLSLPKDLLGKVVVIDFWAVWCGPCIGEIPHMKKVYAAYKDKGVEFVGISLDRDKDTLLAFIKNRKLPWIHTFSGKYWSDPTARKYGIRGIPSIWVVGKDGKIADKNARGDLEGALDKALAAKAEPTTQPAKK